MTPLWMGEVFKLKVKKTKLKVVKDVGHSPHLEAPGKLVKVVGE